MERPPSGASLLTRFQQDWIRLFLPAGFFLTAISLLPLMGAIGLLLSFPAMVLGYIVTLVVADLSVGVPLPLTWPLRLRTGFLAFLAAFFIGGALASGAGDISTLSPLAYTLVVLPILGLLSLGMADTSKPDTIVPTSQAFLIGACLVWILALVVDMISNPLPDILRYTVEALVIMPMLCFPAWLSAQIRTRV